MKKDLEKIGYGITCMFIVSWIWAYLIRGKLVLPAIANTIIGIVVLYGIGLLIFKYITKGIESSTINKYKPSARMLIFAFILQFSSLFILTILTVIVSKLTGKEPGESINSMTPIMLFQLLIFNPIVEEYVFRKLFADKLIKHGELFFMLVSSFCFAMLHGVSLGIPQIVYTFILGMVWSYLYVRTGNIFVPIIMHSLSNLFGSVIIQGLQGISDTLTGIYSMAIMLLGIIGIILFFVNKKHISIDGNNKIISTDIGKTMFTNKGIIFYTCITITMIVLRAMQII